MGAVLLTSRKMDGELFIFNVVVRWPKTKHPSIIPIILENKGDRGISVKTLRRHVMAVLDLPREVDDAHRLRLFSRHLLHNGEMYVDTFSGMKYACKAGKEITCLNLKHTELCELEDKDQLPLLSGKKRPMITSYRECDFDSNIL